MDEARVARCQRVADGDTLTLEDGTRVRLRGVDTPERDQPLGAEAEARLRDLCERRLVLLWIHGRDKYGRVLADVFTDGAVSVQQDLLVSGLAWHYKAYDHRATLAGWEAGAQLARAGVWRSEAAVPPWDWRAQKRAHKR